MAVGAGPFLKLHAPAFYDMQMGASARAMVADTAIGFRRAVAPLVHPHAMGRLLTCGWSCCRTDTRWLGDSGMRPCKHTG